MARPLRLEYSGALYHLTARGNAGSDIFIDDHDRTRFLRYLQAEIAQQGWICYAYCLMNNHYHLMIETPEANLVSGMRRLNGRYSQSFNLRYDRAGHVFQGRYKSIVVEKESYLLELARYIVLNPVRAGMVRRPEQWPWSSYQATAGLSAVPEWLAGNGLKEHFGGSRAYRKFVSDGMGKAPPWRGIHGQIWLGGSAFLEEMEQRIRNMNYINIPAGQTAPARPDADAVLKCVTECLNCDVNDILSRTHRRGYHAAAYLLRLRANLPLKDVANIFGVSVSRISHIQRRIGSSLDIPGGEYEWIKGCKIKN